MVGTERAVLRGAAVTPRLVDCPGFLLASTRRRFVRISNRLRGSGEHL